ncbi:MAG: nucleotidyltransferase [Phycisphaerae bacterium]|nr:nucleotidyltransferase [Phycisphaerae bacterium]
MSKSFITLLELLAKNDVDFVIVGGFAGVVHGCTYVTQDVDVCCDFSPANLKKLQKALKDVHPVHRMTPNHLKLELNDDNAGQFKNLYLDTDIGQLDCLSFIEGVGDFEIVNGKSQLIEVESVKIRVLDIESLIEAKKAMNRPHDLQMLEQLKKIKQANKKTD